MSDPLSIAGSAVGIVSLGITVAQGLVDYYAAFQGQGCEISRTMKKLSGLVDLLGELQQGLEQRQLDCTIRATVESQMADCKDLIRELQEELSKLKRAPRDQKAMAGLRAAGQRFAYPFRRSTLQKLEEDVDEFVKCLSFSMQLMQQRNVASLQDDIEDSKVLLDLVRATQVSWDITNWLQAPDAAINFNELVKKKHPNTGQWFVKGSNFQTWLQKPRSFLWLVGFAGCGKSTLCGTAIQYAFRHRKGNRSIGIAFFFFAFNDERKKDASSMLRALVLQLSSQLSNGHIILLRLRESYRNTSPPEEALMDCLRQLLKAFDHVYIFLDALDESPRDKHREAVLQALAGLRSWPEPSLHVMVSSRDEVDIRHVLEAKGEEIIKMRNDSIDSDIAAFVSRNLRSNKRLRKWQGHYARIETVLTQRAQGVFRWVVCQFEALASCPQSEYHLEKLLDSLPQTLDETYERMLSNIPLESRHESQRMLSMLCCSRRPLTVAELIEGMAVELDDVPKFNPKRKLKDINAIKEICPGFTELDVNLETGETTVCIAHFSVQEYLESERIRESKDAAIYSVTKERADADMARICLTILLEPDLTNSAQTENNRPPFQKLCSNLATADYAARYWPAHYLDCLTNPLVDTLAYRLFERRDGPLKTWVSIWNVDGQHWKVAGKAPAPLYYASLLGLDAIVCKILASHAESASVDRLGMLHTLAENKTNSQNPQKLKDDCAGVNEIGGYYGTALQAASAEGHDGIVRQLLEKGAEVNADGGFYGSALHAAAHKGHEAIVGMLLGEGVDGGTRDRDNASVAVHVATRLLMVTVLGFSAYAITLRLPLLGGMAFCEPVYAYVVGLSASVVGCSVVFGWPFGSWIKCRGLLLKKGVDVNLKDADGRTPLSLAAGNGHSNVTALLLEKGANVHVQDAYGRTSLSYAAENGYDRVTKLLLDKGAVVKADLASPDSKIVVRGHHGAPTEMGDAENMTPLHYTVRFSATKVAELLLRSGISVDVAVHRQVWEHGFDATGGRRIREQQLSQVSFRTGAGLTPLHYAAWVGNEEMVSFFLRHGADPNALSDHGETPLHLAVAKDVKGPRYSEYRDYWTEDDWKIEAALDHAVSEGNEAEYDATQGRILLTRIKVLDALLGHVGTKTSIKDDGGESALHKVQYYKYGSSQFVERLLQKNTECSSRCRDNMTPLHLACKYYDARSVQLLATSAEYLAICDSNGENALHLACKSECIQTMAEVVHACKKYSVDLSSTRNKFGRNALHCYAASIIVEVEGVLLLLDYGVDASETDVDGASPISIYKGRSLGSVEPEICKLLEK